MEPPLRVEPFGHAGGAFPRPDLHERLHRVLEKTKPDLVFANSLLNKDGWFVLEHSKYFNFKEHLHFKEERKYGAELEDIRLMRSHLPDAVKIKASGGVNRDNVLAFIEAGADYIGASSLLREFIPNT